MIETHSDNSNLPQIIYIISDKRAGSTLLDYLLSCHPDVIPLGELRLLSGHYHKIRAGARWNWNCSCGQPVASCKFWTRIFESLHVKEAPDTFIEKSIATINLSESAKKKIKKISYSQTSEHVKKVVDNCWKIYNAVFEQTGKHIITDSSKNAVQAWYLWKHRQGNIKFLILNRDIRAIAFSKMKKTITKDGNENYVVFKDLITTYKVAKQNRLTGDMIKNDGGSVMTISYNDLTDNTEKTITSICNFMNISVFIPPSEFQMHTQHTIAGSPHRFERNAIKKDDRWINFYNKKPFLSFLGKYLADKAR